MYCPVIVASLRGSMYGMARQLRYGAGSLWPAWQLYGGCAWQLVGSRGAEREGGREGETTQQPFCARALAELHSERSVRLQDSGGMATQGFEMVQEAKVGHVEEPMAEPMAVDKTDGKDQQDVGQAAGAGEGSPAWASATVSSHESEEPPSLGEDSVMSEGELDDMIGFFASDDNKTILGKTYVQELRKWKEDKVEGKQQVDDKTKIFLKDVYDLAKKQGVEIARRMADRMEAGAEK